MALPASSPAERQRNQAPRAPGHDEQGRGAEHQGRHGADLQQGVTGYHVADHDAHGDLGTQLEQARRIGLHMTPAADGQDGYHGARYGAAGDVQEEE